jgi:hypothetical protein
MAYAATSGNQTDWEINDFSEGFADRLDNNLIPANTAQSVQNVISRTVGKLEVRRGQEKLNAVTLGASPILGLYAYYKEDGTKKLICAHSGNIYYWDTAASAWVGIHSGLNATANVNFVTTANHVMGFNGVDWPWKWDGAAASVTVVDPLTDTGVANAYVVSDDSGTAVYETGLRIHFMTANANTGASTVNYNNIGVKPILYRGAPLDAGKIARDTVIPLEYNGSEFAIVTTEFVPKDAKNPVLHKEKVFIQVESAPSELWFSEAFEPEKYPVVYTWAFNDGNGEEVTCHIPFLGDLVVFKKTSIHLLRGTTMDDFRADELDSRVGCVGPRAACVHGLKVYHVATDGLYEFNGLRSINISSKKIFNFWRNNVNQTYLHKAVVKVWDGLVWVAFPEGSSTVNNSVLICDPEGNKFWLYRNINGAVLEIFDDGTGEKFYSGDSTPTGFVRQQDVGSDDDGVAIEAWWEGQAYSNETPERFKRARRIFMERYKAEEVYSDTGTVNTYVVTLSPAPLSYTVGLEVWMRAKTTNTGASTINVNGLGTKAIQAEGAALTGGEIEALALVHLVYDGTQFQIQAPMQFQVALDNEDTYTALTMRRDDGLIAQYKFPVSLRSHKKWRYFTPRFYRNALGPCVIRGMMARIKTKANPKVKKPKL